MKKSLSTRIAERAELKAPSRNAKNRASFLALKPDIQQAIHDGWPVKTIWETLHDEGKITFGYQAFRGYVNRLILSAPRGEFVTKTPITLDQIEKEHDKPIAEKKQSHPQGIRGFHYNPVPNPKELF